MNRVLVPVDFSETSVNALNYAIKLFDSSDLELTILHTYDVSSSAFRMKSMDGILERDAQREMDTLLARVHKAYPKLAVETKIVKSKAITAITSLGNSGRYDFIVMGTKGASGLKEVFIGSVAGGVIAQSDTPVLIIPEDSDHHALDKIVLAMSGTPFSDPAIVAPLRHLASMHASKVTLLYVADDQKPDLEPVAETLEEFSPTITYNYGRGSVNEQINRYIERENAKLLCLVRTKKDFFDHLLNESVTLKQTFNSPVPLLILHD